MAYRTEYDELGNLVVVDDEAKVTSNVKKMDNTSDDPWLWDKNKLKTEIARNSAAKSASDSSIINHYFLKYIAAAQDNEYLPKINIDDFMSEVGGDLRNNPELYSGFLNVQKEKGNVLKDKVNTSIKTYNSQVASGDYTGAQVTLDNINLDYPAFDATSYQTKLDTAKGAETVAETGMEKYDNALSQGYITQDQYNTIKKYVDTGLGDYAQTAFTNFVTQEPTTPTEPTDQTYTGIEGTPMNTDPYQDALSRGVIDQGQFDQINKLMFEGNAVGAKEAFDSFYTPPVPTEGDGGVETFGTVDDDEVAPTYDYTQDPGYTDIETVRTGMEKILNESDPEWLQQELTAGNITQEDYDAKIADIGFTAPTRGEPGTFTAPERGVTPEFTKPEFDESYVSKWTETLQELEQPTVDYATKEVSKRVGEQYAFYNPYSLGSGQQIKASEEATNKLLMDVVANRNAQALALGQGDYTADYNKALADWKLDVDTQNADYTNKYNQELNEFNYNQAIQDADYQNEYNKALADEDYKRVQKDIANQKLLDIGQYKIQAGAMQTDQERSDYWDYLQQKWDNDARMAKENYDMKVIQISQTYDQSKTEANRVYQTGITNLANIGAQGAYTGQQAYNQYTGAQDTHQANRIAAMYKPEEPNKWGDAITGALSGAATGFATGGLGGALVGGVAGGASGYAGGGAGTSAQLGGYGGYQYNQYRQNRPQNQGYSYSRVQPYNPTSKLNATGYGYFGKT